MSRRWHDLLCRNIRIVKDKTVLRIWRAQRWAIGLIWAAASQEPFQMMIGYFVNWRRVNGALNLGLEPDWP